MAKGLSLTYHPKSFFKFVLIGFSLVTLPLIAAIVSTGWYVDRLFLQSEYAVYRASQASLVSRSLVDQLTAMERSARQYHVLGDKGLLENYASRREQFHETATELGALSENSFILNQLLTLKAKEGVIFDYLSNPESSPELKPEVEFDGLNNLGRSIFDESQRWITEQVAVLSRMAARVENYLMWLVVALVPFTIMIAVLLSKWISRPIRQVDAAIRQLGDGHFDASIEVGGPKDLQFLGERLNWLRLRLIELEEKKSSFLGLVSHELKTPLTAIREGSSLLGEEALGVMNPQQKEVTALLQRNCIILQKMIENLLNLNMIFAKKTVMNVSEVDMSQIIERVIADHKLAMLSKQIDLDVHVDKLIMIGDKEKLRVIVDNLVSNAVKYSSEGSVLSISLKRVSDNIQLDVADTGPGIDLEDADQVFDAFYRGRSTPNSDIRGSGLGLSIVKEFTQAHKGEIAVLHEEEQVGAHFRVVFPVRLEEKA